MTPMNAKTGLGGLQTTQYRKKYTPLNRLLLKSQKLTEMRIGPSLLKKMTTYLFEVMIVEAKYYEMKSKLKKINFIKFYSMLDYRCQNIVDKG